MTKQSSTRTILLLEENGSDLEGVRRLIKAFPAQFKLESVGDLSVALQRLEKGGVALVLFDLNGGSGLEAIVGIRVRAPHVPIIVLTGLKDREMAVEALSKGAQEYIVKSFLNGQVLARAVGRLLGDPGIAAGSSGVTLRATMSG